MMSNQSKKETQNWLIYVHPTLEHLYTSGKHEKEKFTVTQKWQGNLMLHFHQWTEHPGKTSVRKQATEQASVHLRKLKSYQEFFSQAFVVVQLPSCV